MMASLKAETRCALLTAVFLSQGRTNEVEVPGEEPGAVEGRGEIHQLRQEGWRVPMVRRGIDVQHREGVIRQVGGESSGETVVVRHGAHFK